MGSGWGLLHPIHEITYIYTWPRSKPPQYYQQGYNITYLQCTKTDAPSKAMRAAIQAAPIKTVWQCTSQPLSPKADNAPDMVVALPPPHAHPPLRCMTQPNVRLYPKTCCIWLHGNLPRMTKGQTQTKSDDEPSDEAAPCMSKKSRRRARLSRIAWILSIPRKTTWFSPDPQFSISTLLASLVSTFVTSIHHKCRYSLTSHCR